MRVRYNFFLYINIDKALIIVNFIHFICVCVSYYLTCVISEDISYLHFPFPVSE